MSNSKIKIGNIGTFTRLSKEKFQKHQTSVHNQGGILSINELAFLIIKQSNWSIPDEIRKILLVSGWFDLIKSLNLVVKSRDIKEKIKIRNVEIKTSDLLDEKSAIEESIKFQKFFENWLKNNEFKYTNNKKYFDVTENEFWAARHYGEFRTTQATLNFISMWKNNRSKNLDHIINKLNKLGSDQSNKNLDESEDLDSTIRSNGQIVAYQNWDSGGPGAGAGSVKCYFYNNSFFVFHDAGMDEYNSAKAAIESNGINVRTDATVEIWINKTFYK